MTEFKSFQAVVHQQLEEKLYSHQKLFRVNLSGDQLWDLYLQSFPKGTNPLFRERTEHDCNCCRHFIRNIGNLVAIDDDNKLITVWENYQDLPEPYHTVSKKLHTAVQKARVDSLFFVEYSKMGQQQNVDNYSDIIWNHFYTEVPARFVTASSARLVGQFDNDLGVFLRGLTEFSPETLTLVQELVNENAFYRADTYAASLNGFIDAYKQYRALPVKQQHNWLRKVMAQGVTGALLRNTAIGSLLQDIESGRDLDSSVKAFENMVAPENYRRTSAVITQSMIKQAEKKVIELDLVDSLTRRHASIGDIPVSNVLFTQQRSNLEGLDNPLQAVLGPQATPIPKNLDRVKKVSLQEFKEKILPGSKAVEVYFEPRQQGNLMSLVAPVNAAATPLLNWNNNFSWAYNGDVADAIKERVKKAGGNTDAFLRVSLAWSDGSDLDLHLNYQSKHIYFSNKRDSSLGVHLDVDMNAGSADNSVDPVENIYFSDRSKIKPGIYEIGVHQFSKRSGHIQGFTLQIELDGVIQEFEYPQPLPTKKFVNAASIHVSKSGEITIQSTLATNGSTVTTKEIWGVNTGTFVPVTFVLNSPNHWETKSGQEHLFFILDKCKTNEPVRGFFNEFLRSDLREHRKVFEVLGSKMMVEPSDQQLSGLGFTSGRNDSVICRVTGSKSQIFEIQF